MPKDYDFSGWATRFGVKCSDGRTITSEAFRDNNGITVPLVYSHVHDDISNVLGHAVLEHRDSGMYAYGYLNNTKAGNDAREQLKNGDLKYLSIYANRLTERNGAVLHGDIKEVSLVLAGANPGAMIDVPYIEHDGFDNTDFEGIIYNDEELYLSHSEEEEGEMSYNTNLSHADGERTVEEVVNSMTEEQRKVLFYLLSQVSGEEDEEGTNLEHSDGATVEDVIDSMTGEQQDVLFYLLDQMSEEDDYDDEEDYYDDEEDYYDDEDYYEEGEDSEMKHNVFDNETSQGGYLSHEDMDMIFSDAKRLGSLRDAVTEYEENGFLAHADDDRPVEMEATYGVDRIDWLFPEARYTNNMPPEFIKRETGWVQKVMGKVHHTPFSRIKSMFADITMEEARAKGYMKGNLKKEEVFTLLKRSTTPQTIYKKQKLDKDDIRDITDFDVVSWIKGEMRMMLDEEIARAILVGDGRSGMDDDKISEDHIRPVWLDKPLYTVRASVALGGDNSETAKNMIDTSIRSRKYYKGSGTPTLFTTEDWLTEMLLLEDGIGHKLYKSESELATTMRVSEIVTVPVMENLTHPDTHKSLGGIIVNLVDYNVGADKGGAVDMFEDFDIDYNQEKYLIETRCSGALIKPFSAIALEIETA